MTAPPLGEGVFCPPWHWLTAKTSGIKEMYVKICFKIQNLKNDTAISFWDIQNRTIRETMIWIKYKYQTSFRSGKKDVHKKK